MKRRLLKIFIALSLLAVGCLVYGFFIEPYRLVVRHVEITSPHWQGEPLRIAVLSDIHVGGRKVHAPRVEKVVARTNVEDADMMLLAGDYTSGSSPRSYRGPGQIADIEAGHAALGKLSAPLGVFAVRGNHDYQYGAELVQANLEAGGIIFVDNRAQMVGERFCVFGVDDDIFGAPNANGRDACPAAKPMIGVMHSPDNFALMRGGEALLIAGHTHGGQINIPGIGRRVTSTKAGMKYAYGKVRVGDAPGFVTAGIGMSILSARFRAPPEIVIITLTK